MTIAIETPVTVTDDIHTATDAASTLADVLNRAVIAGNTVVTKKYGADSDKRSPLAAVKLAKAVADDISGAHKSKGGARANVLAVLDSLATLALSPTDTVLVSLSRARLDLLAAEKREATKAASEARAAAKAVLNDRTAAKADRIAALELMTEIDDVVVNSRNAVKFGALVKAIEAARDFGYTREQISSVVDAAFGIGI